MNKFRTMLMLLGLTLITHQQGFTMEAQAIPQARGNRAVAVARFIGDTLRTNKMTIAAAMAGVIGGPECAVTAAAFTAFVEKCFIPLILRLTPAQGQAFVRLCIRAPMVFIIGTMLTINFCGFCWYLMNLTTDDSSPQAIILRRISGFSPSINNHAACATVNDQFEDISGKIIECVNRPFANYPTVELFDQCITPLFRTMTRLVEQYTQNCIDPYEIKTLEGMKQWLTEALDSSFGKGCKIVARDTGAVWRRAEDCFKVNEPSLCLDALAATSTQLQAFEGRCCSEVSGKVFEWCELIGKILVENYPMITSAALQLQSQYLDFLVNPVSCETEAKATALEIGAARECFETSDPAFHELCFEQLDAATKKVNSFEVVCCAGDVSQQRREDCNALVVSMREMLSFLGQQFRRLPRANGTTTLVGMQQDAAAE